MSYTLLNKATLPKSRLELALEIAAAAIAAERERVLEEAAKEAVVDGFRKGKVPKEIIRKRMGELALWEEAAMRSLSESLADIFKKEELDVIGRPELSITKLAPDNPAGFKIIVSLFPKLSLPDYTSLAAKHSEKPVEAGAVEEKEIDTVIAEIAKEHERKTQKKDFAVSEENVKELGEFLSVADLRAKVTETLIAHKRTRAGERRRAELLDQLADGTKGEIPDILVENELNRLEGELKSQIEHMGATFEQYLKEIKKDRETIRVEWRADAEKRARLQLLLAKIAEAEKIIAPAEQVEAEVKRILAEHKDADAEAVRIFVETLLANEKVIAFLEDQK